MSVKGMYYFNALHGGDDDRVYQGEVHLADLDTPMGDPSVELYVWLEGQECAIGAVHVDREELLAELAESAEPSPLEVAAKQFAQEYREAMRNLTGDARDAAIQRAAASMAKAVSE